jgi:hypothetical protein
VFFHGQVLFRGATQTLGGFSPGILARPVRLSAWTMPLLPRIVKRADEGGWRDYDSDRCIGWVSQPANPGEMNMRKDMNLEQRLAALERAVADIQRQLMASLAGLATRIDNVSGSISNDPVFYLPDPYEPGNAIATTGTNTLTMRTDLADEEYEPGSPLPSPAIPYQNDTSFTADTRAVVLAPDIAAFFPDAESVNDALRVLVKIARKIQKPPS